MITQEELKKLFNYDPETGVLYRSIDSGMGGRFKKGSPVGSKSHGYLTTRVNNKLLRVHRIIWKLLYNEEPEQIDHINGIRDDNRLCNLRPATNQLNSMNKAMRYDNTSGINGIRFQDNAWRADIRVNGKARYLGRYKTKEEAIKARKEAEVKYGFSVLHGRKAV